MWRQTGTTLLLCGLGWRGGLGGTIPLIQPIPPHRAAGLHLYGVKRRSDGPLSRPNVVATGSRALRGLIR